MKLDTFNVAKHGKDVNLSWLSFSVGCVVNPWAKFVIATLGFALHFLSSLDLYL